MQKIRGQNQKQLRRLNSVQEKTKEDDDLGCFSSEFEIHIPVVSCSSDDSFGESSSSGPYVVDEDEGSVDDLELFDKSEHFSVGMPSLSTINYNSVAADYFMDSCVNLDASFSGFPKTKVESSPPREKVMAETVNILTPAFNNHHGAEEKQAHRWDAERTLGEKTKSDSRLMKPIRFGGLQEKRLSVDRIPCAPRRQNSFRKLGC